MGSPMVKGVTNLNKAVKMLKETSDAKWKFMLPFWAHHRGHELRRGQSTFDPLEVSRGSVTAHWRHRSTVYLPEWKRQSTFRTSDDHGKKQASRGEAVDLCREFAKEKFLYYTDAKSLRPC